VLKPSLSPTSAGKIYNEAISCACLAKSAPTNSIAIILKISIYTVVIAAIISTRFVKIDLNFD